MMILKRKSGQGLILEVGDTTFRIGVKQVTDSSVRLSIEATRSEVRVVRDEIASADMLAAAAATLARSNERAARCN